MGLGGVEPPTSRLSGVRSNQAELQALLLETRNLMAIRPPINPPSPTIDQA